MLKYIIVKKLFIYLQSKTKTIIQMTLQDIRNSRPSKELVKFKKTLETKIEKCRSLTEYEKLDNLINEIDKILKY